MDVPLYGQRQAARQVQRAPARLGARGEWVRLRNVSRSTVALTGWTIRDRGGATFRFRRLALAPGRAVTVVTGRGRDRAGVRFWGRRGEVWGDRGDAAALRTAQGALVDTCAYRGSPRGFAAC